MDVQCHVGNPSTIHNEQPTFYIAIMSYITGMQVVYSVVFSDQLSSLTLDSDLLLGKLNIDFR